MLITKIAFYILGLLSLPIVSRGFVPTLCKLFQGHRSCACVRILASAKWYDQRGLELDEIICLNRPLCKEKSLENVGDSGYLQY